MEPENNLTITKDRRVLLNGVEVPQVLGVSIDLEAGRDPEVVLRVSVQQVDIDGYSDYWKLSK